MIRGHWRETQGLHPLDQVQHADLMTYLPGDILTKVDRASMAHALEVRVPLLDHVLVEWATTLPAELRLNPRGSKFVLKTALGPYLPSAILRRRKNGCAVRWPPRSSELWPRRHSPMRACSTWPRSTA
jgi:asparagine synthase (glutamine-hydrolysing)